MTDDMIPRSEAQIEWLQNVIDEDQRQLLTDYEVHPDAWSGDPDRSDAVRALAEQIEERFRSEALAMVAEAETAVAVLARAYADALAALEAVEKEEQAKFLAGDWDDRDDDMTAAIRADFGSDGFFERYDRAMQLVGNRKSKGSLVALVCFLLRATNTQEGEG